MGLGAILVLDLGTVLVLGLGTLLVVGSWLVSRMEPRLGTRASSDYSRRIFASPLDCICRRRPTSYDRSNQ